jgi:hypothetical protein
VLILILGSISYSGYEVIALLEQRIAVSQAIEQMDSKVRYAEYEHAKLEAVAQDILNLASTDKNAAQIVTEYKIARIEPVPSDVTAATNSPDTTIR